MRHAEHALALEELQGRRRRPSYSVPHDAQLRHARAVKAGRAARAAHDRRREERGDRFTTKGKAYAAGYREGYMTAMRWWRRKAEREARVRGAA